MCRRLSSILGLLVSLGSGIPGLEAATYYLHPGGSNSASGTTESTPWLTFGHAIPRLEPGDTLVLLPGVYTPGTHGAPFIQCGSTARQGTARAPITVKAARERQAWIRGDGRTIPFRISHCAYWTIEGLRISSVDNVGVQDPHSDGSIFRGGSSSHLTIRRNLLHHNNRYANGTALDAPPASLVEENEVYWYHRNGIAVSRDSVIRRNYINSRHYPDIAGGRYSGEARLGDSGFLLYPDATPITETLVENNISENNGGGFEIQSAYAAVRGNTFLGNISLGDLRGFYGSARRENPGVNQMYPQTTIRDHVVIHPRSVGLFLRSPKALVLDGVTVIMDPHSAAVGGLLFSLGSGGAAGDGAPTFQAQHVLVTGTPGGGSYAGGVVVDTAVFRDWTLRHANVASAPAYRPAQHGALAQSRSIDPQLGACRVTIPATSPMKGAGAGGADIGANVWYRYQDGTLTTVPLWDPQTGAFPHGAVIAGVNDIAGSSLFDVHLRLNVQATGCGGRPPVPAPTRLTGRVQTTAQ